MNKKKLIITIGILILIIIFLMILIRIFNNKEEGIKQQNNPYNIDESEIIKDYKKDIVSNETNFYTVENCINLYLKEVNKANLENVSKLLSSQYIQKNNITISNIGNYINDNLNKITAIEMYFLDGERTQEYAVKAVDDNNKTYYFIVILDIQNTTFAIEPILNKKVESLSNIELNHDFEIEDKEINKYVYIRYTDEDMSYKYYEYYINLLLNDRQKAFDLLNKEYKNRKFNNDINEFEIYINRNKENLQKSILTKYSYNKKENNSEYVLLNNNDMYFKIEEKSIMNFEVILDDYTILSEEYISKYKKLSDSEKLSSNIQMIILMLNNKDYKTIYSKLDDTFKLNNFDTQEKFDMYVAKNFFNYNVYEPENVKREGEIYIVSGILRSGNTVSAREKNFTVIMQLKEDTDFKISFSFDK